MASAARLVEEGELEECAHVGAVGSEGDEDGDVGTVVLGVLTVGIEVDGPVIASDGEDVAGEVVAGAHALGEGEALDGVLVGAPHGLRDGPRPGRRRRHRIRQPNPSPWVGGYQTKLERIREGFSNRREGRIAGGGFREGRFQRGRIPATCPPLPESGGAFRCGQDDDDAELWGPQFFILVPVLIWSTGNFCLRGYAQNSPYTWAV